MKLRNFLSNSDTLPVGCFTWPHLPLWVILKIYKRSDGQSYLRNHETNKEIAHLPLPQSSDWQSCEFSFLYCSNEIVRTCCTWFWSFLAVGIQVLLQTKRTWWFSPISIKYQRSACINLFRHNSWTTSCTKYKMNFLQKIQFYKQ
jgi:hypothetical protein